MASSSSSNFCPLRKPVRFFGFDRWAKPVLDRPLFATLRPLVKNMADAVNVEVKTGFGSGSGSGSGGGNAGRSPAKAGSGQNAGMLPAAAAAKSPAAAAGANPAQAGADDAGKNRGWPKGKKRYPKSPGAPKQPLSGYVHFLNDRRESVRKENPDMSFADIRQARREPVVATGGSQKGIFC